MLHVLMQHVHAVAELNMKMKSLMNDDDYCSAFRMIG
jgi:hypothetical protein